MITLSHDGPWDFINHFPAPLPEVVEAGLIDGDPESIEAIHTEQMHEIVAILHEIIHLKHCRKMGVDPRTGRKPSRQAKPVEWHRLIRTAWRSFVDCIAVYADAFGQEAGYAFKRFCVAMVEGVLIVEIGTDTLNLPPPPTALDQLSDDDVKRAKLIEFFDSHCPPVWATGTRIWNADKLGRYRAGFRTSYQPDHPFYYHQAGKPLSADELVKLVEPVETGDLGDYLFGKHRKRDFELMLKQYRQDMAESQARYDTIYNHGPKGLSNYTKSHGNYGHTPMTLWGETMAMLARQIMHKASVIKAIESHRAIRQVKLQSVGIGEQMILFGGDESPS